MLDSAGIGALIARWGFWFLLLYGLARRELRPKHVAVFLVLWLAGCFGLPLLPIGTALFTSFVAGLDIALVLMISKGDVRIF